MSQNNEMYMIFASDRQLELMRRHGSVIMVDGTFNYVEDKYDVLTLLMPYDNGTGGSKKGIPVMWIIADGKSEENYKRIFKNIKEDIFNNTWRPTDFLTDFKNALQNGILYGLPNTRVYGDSFHLLQACRKHLSKDYGWERDRGQLLWKYVSFFP